MSEISPEETTLHRIHKLESEILSLRKQNHILEGKLQNRPPKLQEAIQRENEFLTTRLQELQRMYTLLLLEQGHPFDLNDAKKVRESQKTAVIRYLKHHRVDPELWKKIES